MPEPETVIPVTVDESTRRAVEAILHPLGLTPSQLFSLLMEAIARDDIFARVLVKEVSRFGAAPIKPNAETVAALEAAERGEFSGLFNTIEELMAHLHAND
jgi:antitoxin component of RelBE/YafQ-DinJ toxin-antitoxin module